MQTFSQIRDLLAQRGIRPKHRYGQNFLHDQNQLRKLVAAAEVQPGDLILEVGPGTGTLTETLLEAGADVIACEIDADMAAIIRDHLTPPNARDESSNRGVRSPRLTLLEADILSRKHAINPQVRDYLDRPFKLVANLPYQVASPLILTLLVEHPVGSLPAERNRLSFSTRGPAPCTGLYITVQREAADRIISPPGRKEYGVLSVLCQSLAEVRVISRLGPDCFWPAPKVASAMIAVRPRPQPGISDPRDFSEFLQRLFRHRRKQLGALLGRDRSWPAGIRDAQRPEELKIEQMVALYRFCAGETAPNAVSDQ